ncbi:MAG: CPBP family intramembrane glutamic endopeptidase [Flavobacterium sp.]
MFIEQAFKKETDLKLRILNFIKYLGGSFLVFLAAMVGQIPLSIAVLFSGKMPQNNADLYSLFDSNVFLFFALLTFVFAFIGLYLVVEKLHLQKFISIITSRERLDWSRIFVSFGLWLIISVILFFASYFYDSSEIVLQFNLIPFAILSFITLILMPIQTTAEELLFRGYLMQGFYNLSLNKWFPLLMTSLIFGTMHIMNPEVERIGYLILVYYIGTGLFLGIITLMDEGTELALGFHAANNIIASLLITTDYTVFQTHSIFKDISEPSINFEVFFPVLVLFPILLFYFSKKYKWNHWKEKLIGTK